MLSFLYIAAHKLVSLKSIIISLNREECDEYELPAAVYIPPLYCPSLTMVWLWGNTSVAAPFIQSLILPNINTLTKILLLESRPDLAQNLTIFALVCVKAPVLSTYCVLQVLI